MYDRRIHRMAAPAAGSPGQVNCAGAVFAPAGKEEKMYAYMEEKICPRLEIPGEKPVLPTGGAVVNAVESVKDGSGIWSLR